MVPTQNLIQDQRHDHPFSTIYNKSALIMANKEDIARDETQNKEETDTNPKDWLQLGFGSSNLQIRNGGPVELELFTERPPYQKRQVANSSKRPRHAFLDHLQGLRSPFNPSIGGEIRVIAPPRRPEAGLWLILCADQNQLKEPILPQIERSYLRFKESNITVRVLMKYLANKLDLGNESEVEISCKGRSLPPFLMLQYVRDHIWRSKQITEFSTRFTATDHLMTLHYSRRRINGLV